MESGEPDAKIKNKDEVEEDKRPLNIRIAIFFDGTLNNRVNISEREKDSDIYKEFRDSDAPTSYDNGRTNIAIMEPHVEKSAEGYDFCMKTYVEGQGTLDLEGDSFKGYALGGGISGVADRSNLGIQRAVELIVNEQEIEKNEYFIKKLTIDVFGFSRGAATARYAIYVLFDGRVQDINPHTGQILYAYDPLHMRLNNMGYEIEKSAVEVCFAGLYDTVLSYYGSQYFSFTKNVLQQKAVARAKKVLHLAAADEHRKDFPLHNISSAKHNGGEEYYLPGVHSDIGGSYNQANELELEAETEEDKKVYMLTSDEDLVILEGKKAVLEEDREYLIDQGWYNADEIIIEPKNKNSTRTGRNRRMSYTYQLKVTRNNIHSAYSNIPLKIMADYARNSEVKLKINNKLDRRADKILESESDLKKLEIIIKDYITKKKNSKNTDWIGDRAQLNTKTLKAIRNKHFHFSSKPGMGYAPRIVKDRASGKNRRTRFIYDA